MRQSGKAKSAKKVKATAIPAASRLGWTCLSLCLFILSLDQAVKYFVHLYIPQLNHLLQWYPYGGIGVFENFHGIEFSIVHAINRGAAWGFFADFPDALFMLRIFFVFMIIVYLLFFNKKRGLLLPLTLILAGALGNIIDFFAYGHVIDMFHFVFWGHPFAIFNVADSSISLGVGSIILMTLANRNNLAKFDL